MARIYLALIIIGLFGAIGSAGYYYYTTTQKAIAQLKENNYKLKVASATLQDTLESVEKDFHQTEINNRELSRKLKKAESILDGLKLRLSEINLTREAETDPNGLTERVNAAVDKLRKELQNETTPGYITDQPDSK